MNRVDKGLGHGAPDSIAAADMMSRSKGELSVDETNAADTLA